MMTLLEAIRDLDSLDTESTIYAREPWTDASEVLVAPEPETGGVPKEAQKLGLKYFLEVFVALDFLEGWLAGLGQEPALQEKCERLIQYAKADS